MVKGQAEAFSVENPRKSISTSGCLINLKKEPDFLGDVGVNTPTSPKKSGTLHQMRHCIATPLYMAVSA